MEQLADMKCQACEGGVEPLSQDEAEKLREQVPDWQIADDHIERTLKFANFVEAMKFANRITNAAEEENHHPDLHISWGRVRIELSTHSVDGLTINDFILAARIDRLAEKNNVEQAI